MLPRSKCHWCGTALPREKIKAVLKIGSRKEEVRFCGNSMRCLENALAAKDCRIELIR